MIITELVFMKTLEGIKKENFIEIVDKLEENFHKPQAGFIDSELLYDEKNNEWIMVQHWKTLEQLKASSKQIFVAKEAKEFVQSLQPENVKMLILPQIRQWK